MSLVGIFAAIKVRKNRRTRYICSDLLLLLSGDVETNPGPPKNKGPPGGRPKEPTKEEIMAALKQKERCDKTRILTFHD